MSGASSRFVQAGYSTPKSFLEFNSKPLIYWILKQFESVDRTTLVVRDDLEPVYVNVLKGLEHELDRRLEIKAIPAHKNGPTETILAVRESINSKSRLVVSYCDFAAVFDEDFFWSQLEASDGVIGTYTGFHPHMLWSTKYAYARREKAGYIDQIQEKKPFTSHPMSEHASSGCYASAEASDLIDALLWQKNESRMTNGEYYISEAMNWYPQNGKKLVAVETDLFFQWGTPADYQRSVEEFNSASRVSEHQRRYMSGERPNAGRDPNLGLISAGDDGLNETNTNVLLLAAGTGARFRVRGYEGSKAFFDISGQSAFELASSSVPGAQQYIAVFQKNDLADLPHESWTTQNRVSIEIDGVTEGQAATALLGLEEFEKSDIPVVILPCDALLTDARSEWDDKTAAVFLSTPTASQIASANQYSWATLNNHGEIDNIFVKEGEIPSNAFRLTGAFRFSSVQQAKTSLSRLNSVNRVNGEIYLDSVFKEMAATESVKGIVVKSNDFGTPEEYETLVYWMRALDFFTLRADK